jgi:hypothetical protein
MLTKLQTNDLIQTLIDQISKTSDISRYLFYIEYFQKKLNDNTFCLNDDSDWIAWFHEINQFDHQAWVTYQICKNIVYNPNLSGIFKTSISIARLFYSQILIQNLLPHHKKLMIELLVWKQINIVCFTTEDSLRIIQSIAHFLKLNEIEDFLNELPEYIFYRLILPWKNLDNLNCISDNLIFKSWLEQEHLQNYSHMLKHLNAMLSEWSISPIRTFYLHHLKIALLSYWYHQLLTFQQLNMCLIFISYFENHIIQQFATRQELEPNFPITITHQSSQSIALIEIDVLIDLKNQNLSYHPGLVDALKVTRLHQVYLFSDTPCNANQIQKIEQVIEKLAQDGIEIKGLLSPLDLIGDLDQHQLINLYELIKQNDRYDAILDKTGEEIIKRLMQGFYPPHINNFYKKQKEDFTVLEKSPPMLAQFDNDTNLLLHMLHKLVDFVIDRNKSKKGINHIQGFLFEQFLVNNYTFEHIYVFHSSEIVLENIEKVFQHYNLSCVHLNTMRILNHNAPEYSREYYFEGVIVHNLSRRNQVFLIELSQLPLSENAQTRPSIFRTTSPQSNLKVIINLLKEYIATSTLAARYKCYKSIQVMLDNLTNINSIELQNHHQMILNHFPEFQT